MASRWTLALALLLLACSEEDPGSRQSSGVTWCQALGVLETSCQRCHGEPSQNGAPFPLITYEHTQILYGNAQVPLPTKMRSAVASDFMPLQIPIDPPVQPLTCEQKTTLLTWLDEGAEAVGGVDCSASDKTLLPCNPDLAGGAGGAGN